MALAVDDACRLGRVASELRTEVCDDPILDEHAARFVAVVGGVDEARIEEGDGLRRRCPVLAHGRPQWLGSWRPIASSTAIRTATPISTWSRITLREWSAMVEAISTPRFMGP